MRVYAEQRPEWLGVFTPDNFKKIPIDLLLFYVFYSPCIKLTVRSISLAEYGWRRPWSKPYYLNKQLRQASSNYNLIYSCDKYDKMDDNLEKSDLKDGFPSELFKERICIYDCMHNQFMSVFYHLRNSIAHGRFNLLKINDENVFIFEDVAPGQVVSARMILKMSTLKKWIKIIKKGEKEFEIK